MTSELRVDKIHNEGGDNDSGLDMSTNDVVAVKIAGSEKMRVHSDGTVGIGTTSPSRQLTVQNTIANSGGVIGLTSSDSTTSGTCGIIHFGNSTDSSLASINGIADGATDAGAMVFKTEATGGSIEERARIDSSGHILVGQNSTTTPVSGNTVGTALRTEGRLEITCDDNTPLRLNRKSDDGTIIQIRQNGSIEGTISVSGSTVSYGGFVGLHESSGIATSTPVGTVVSTIDELDVYPVGTSKAGQTRADHAKIKVSDAVGDKRVYGVVQKFDAEYYNKLQVASVGVGSVRVTGACAGGDLLESNGDGTAKVQSDDIVRSKTIGKVTIGNSNTGVKLVSCVLYCG